MGSPSARPSILQLVTDRDRRGAQVFATDLADALTDQGWTVRTVALANGISAARLPIPALGGTRRLTPRSLLRLRREMRATDVTIAHGSSTLVACAIAGTGLRRGRVYRQISDSLFWAPTRSRQMRVGASMRRYDRIVALYPGAADTLVDHFGVSRSKLVVIPNGVPESRFPPADASEQREARVRLGLAADTSPLLLYVGALVPEKGVDLAIDAIEEMPEASLLVVGDGPERERLTDLAKVRAPGRVHFSGLLDFPLDAYRAADLVVLPSRGGDSMPAVLIEASFVGRPTLSTPVEGIPEIVRDGLTGRLVPIDDRAALMRAVRDISEHADAYGSGARAHALERFEIHAVARAWGAVVAEASARGVRREA